MHSDANREGVRCLRVGVRNKKKANSEAQKLSNLSDLIFWIGFGTRLPFLINYLCIAMNTGKLTGCGFAYRVLQVLRQESGKHLARILAKTLARTCIREAWILHTFL